MPNRTKAKRKSLETRIAQYEALPQSEKDKRRKPGSRKK